MYVWKFRGFESRPSQINNLQKELLLAAAYKSAPDGMAKVRYGSQYHVNTNISFSVSPTKPGREFSVSTLSNVLRTGQ